MNRDVLTHVVPKVEKAAPMQCRIPPPNGKKLCAG